MVERDAWPAEGRDGEDELQCDLPSWDELVIPELVWDGGVGLIVLSVSAVLLAPHRLTTRNASSNPTG